MAEQKHQPRNDFKIPKKQSDAIIQDCCLKFLIQPDQLHDKSRKQNFVVCRAIICKILNSMGMSLEEIGEMFGDRDHSTMSNCLKIVEQILTQGNSKYKIVTYDLVCKHIDNEHYLKTALNYHMEQIAFINKKLAQKKQVKRIYV